MSPAARSRCLRSGLAALLVLACSGCGAHGDDAVRRALTPVLKSFEAGHPRQGLALLLGKPVDAYAWQRTLEVMHRLDARPAVLQARACAHHLEALARAVEMYRADDSHAGTLPERLDDLVGWGGVKAIPTCPSDGRPVAWKPDRAHGTFVLYCTGGHAAAGMKPGYPRVDSRWGLSADDGEALASWPHPYGLELRAVRIRGSRATVDLRERSGGATANPELTLAEQPDGGWVLAPDNPPAEQPGALGHLLDTWMLTAAHPVDPEVARRACRYGLGRVAAALEMYASDHRGRYPARLQELTPVYRPRLDILPGAGRDGLPTYRTSPGGDSYVLSCAGQQLSNRPGPAAGAGTATLATGAAESDR